MTAVVSLEVKSRSQNGTGAARALRRENNIPGILYGAGKGEIMLAIDEKTLLKELSDPHYPTKLYDLKVDGQNQRALIRAVQLHPVTDKPLHIDFLRVDKSSRITIKVPVHFKNEDKSPGIKRGGVLNIVLHELELSCPADSIPDEIAINLEGLEIGNSIHLGSIELPAGVQAAHANRDYTIATIVAPSGLKSEETTTTEGAATEGAAGTENKPAAK